MLAALGLVLSLAGRAADSQPDVEPLVQPTVVFPKDTTTQLQDAVNFAMAATGSPGAVVGVWAPWSGSGSQEWEPSIPAAEPPSRPLRSSAPERPPAR